MPDIAIITPSYNQGQFIERTIQSVLNEKNVEIEYIVVDGASTDNTVDVLKQFGEKLRWVSEPDRGQTHAVNKGIQMTSADIIGWLNSDDIFYPGAIQKAVAFFAANPKIDVIYGDANHIDVNDQVIEPYYTENWNLERLKEVCYLCQPAVFFRRKVIERFGQLNENLQYCMDYEFWLRLAKAGVSFYRLPQVLAGSRLHADTKTLGSSVKVHSEINDMLRQTFQRVPDRWLSNYAHALVANDPLHQKDTQTAKRKIAIETILASFRWNKWISFPLMRMTLLWLASSFKKAT
ncbi:MAG: glycosyltransferase family 2 protein [Gammaproteobacteria bacterium]|nr:glycosyltransferase family 2 protein [Gammaproteobacteria bacterium]